MKKSPIDRENSRSNNTNVMIFYIWNNIARVNIYVLLRKMGKIGFYP
ncbi:hypothetical protein [Sporosalibacterium faouarense]|nr:hypothetical protein [Sporosalibacterium faouarense]